MRELQGLVEVACVVHLPEVAGGGVKSEAERLAKLEAIGEEEGELAQSVAVEELRRGIDELLRERLLRS